MCSSNKFVFPTSTNKTKKKKLNVDGVKAIRSTFEECELEFSNFSSITSWKFSSTSKILFNILICLKIGRIFWLEFEIYLTYVNSYSIWDIEVRWIHANANSNCKILDPLTNSAP